MQLEVSNLYPIPIGKTHYPNKITKKEHDYALSCEIRNNVGNTTSTDKNVLERKEFKKLKKFCEESVNLFYQRTMRPKDPAKLFITQSWINVCEKDQYHHKHHHPNSVYSGVFYIQADPNLDKIAFSNPSKFFLYQIPESYTVWNSQIWEMTASTGILYMFPSYFEHEVPKSNNPNKRISLSFNTWVKGEFGNVDESTYLHLK
jgi:uncharacterized protein (TIGR02466 family)